MSVQTTVVTHKLSLYIDFMFPILSIILEPAILLIRNCVHILYHNYANAMTVTTSSQ